MTINSLDEHNICIENIIESFSHSNDNDKLINVLVDATNKLFQLIQALSIHVRLQECIYHKS